MIKIYKFRITKDNNIYVTHETISKEEFNNFKLNNILAILYYNIDTNIQAIKFNEYIFNKNIQNSFEFSNNSTLLYNLDSLVLFLTTYLNECVRVSKLVSDKYVTAYIGTMTEDKNEKNI